jgi:hypothetical protein
MIRRFPLVRSAISWTMMSQGARLTVRRTAYQCNRESGYIGDECNGRRCRSEWATNPLSIAFQIRLFEIQRRETERWTLPTISVGTPRIRTDFRALQPRWFRDQSRFEIPSIQWQILHGQILHEFIWIGRILCESDHIESEQPVEKSISLLFTLVFLLRCWKWL